MASSLASPPRPNERDVSRAANRWIGGAVDKADDVAPQREVKAGCSAASSAAAPTAITGFTPTSRLGMSALASPGAERVQQGGMPPAVRELPAEPCLARRSPPAA